MLRGVNNHKPACTCAKVPGQRGRGRSAVIAEHVEAEVRQVLGVFDSPHLEQAVNARPTSTPLGRITEIKVQMDDLTDMLTTRP
jgi:hypothetical protein